MQQSMEQDELLPVSKRYPECRHRADSLARDAPG